MTSASSAPATAPSPRPATRRTVLLLALAGAAAASVAASQPWGSGTADGGEVAVRAVTASGGELSPVVPGLALVGGAAAVAAATTGRAARRVAVAALGLAGIGVVAATLVALGGLAAALGRRAAELSARTGVVPMTAHATAWPWLAVAGGALLVLAAVLAALGLRRWPLPSRRYERASAGPGDAARTEPLADDLGLWESVGRELDVEPPSRATPAEGHPTGTGRPGA